MWWDPVLICFLGQLLTMVLSPVELEANLMS